MRVERVTWGKWFTVAIAVGLIIAWLHATLGQSSFVQTIAQVQFINMLNRPPQASADGKQKFPWIRSVTVYPAVEIVQVSGKASTRKAPVTYLMLAAATKGTWQYVSKSTLVDDPISVGGRDPVPLTTYLTAVTKDRPLTTFRYAFWDEPRWIYGLWVGSCVLVIGIIWPFVLRRLAAAGYAGQPDDNEPTLWQRWRKMFSRKPKPTAGAEEGITSSVSKPLPTALSDEDMQKIAAMEEKLGDFGQTAREPGGEVADEAEPAIKTLAAGPMETANQPEKKEEPKEYAGEYYPTATHVPKKKAE